MGIPPFTPAGLMVAALLFARWAVQLWLARLNGRYVLAHAVAIPSTFQGMVDAETYAKSVRYTLAKNRFGQLESTYESLVVVGLLFSGVLPWAFDFFTVHFGGSVCARAALLFASGVALALSGLPFDWFAQFRLEERFGFNTTTQKLWWLDRLKGLLLGLALGYPLLALVLKLVDWTGEWWWLWAWACLVTFQLAMAVVAPVLILPLFNKFTPLVEGNLSQRLQALGQRTGVSARSIQVMDGSKRSRHSNAFFTGFGRFRKLVLFDTLIQQLTEPELEAVLAHEIGHFKHRDIPKMIGASAASSLIGFYAVSWLARQAWFNQAFGFSPDGIVPALWLCVLAGGVVTFWLSPLAHWWSRRCEYAADRYAANTMGERLSLTGALRKLNAENLSNLTPHPVYSGFYYSHPTLLERERALREGSPGAAAAICPKG